MKKHFYLQDIIDICKHNHLTAEQIYEKLKQKNPSVWRATVYRNVDLLVKEWKLRKIEVDKISYYETVIENHFHIIDKKEGKIIDLDPEEVIDFLKNFKDRKYTLNIILE